MTPRSTQHSALSTPSSTPDARLLRLHAALREAQGRFRLREAAWHMPVAVVLGLGAAVIVALVWRLAGTLAPLDVAWSGLLLVGAAALTAFLYAWLRPRDSMHTARMADHLLGLDERLATALEASTRLPEAANPAQVQLRSAQLDDALQHSEAALIRRSLPVRVEAVRFIPAGAIAALLLAVLLVPNPFSPKDGVVQAQISHEQKQVQAIEEAAKAQPRLAQDPTLQALLKELSDLSRDLSAGDLKREEAVARLSEAENKLQKLADAQARAERAALDELAKQLAGSQDAVAKQVGDALKSGDPQVAADALKNAASNADKMSPQERRAISDALKAAQGSVAALDPELATRLNEAAQALSGNDPQAAQKAVDDLAQKIEQTGQNLATQQQISQALAQLQMSKQNISQAGQTQGQSTPQAGSGTAIANATANAYGTALAGANGTSIAQGTVRLGSPVALGSPMPGLTPGTPGKGGTPVAIPGQQGGQGGQPGGQGGQQGGIPGQAQGQGGNQGWGVGHQEPVYAPPSHVSATLTPVVLQGQTNPGGEQGTAPINGGTGLGQAQVPYEQVFGQYKEQAGNALNSDYIPQGYKDLVRDYFSELEPGK